MLFLSEVQCVCVSVKCNEERVLAFSGVGGEHICVSVQHLMRLLLSSALECKGLKICVETFFFFVCDFCFL